MERITRKMLERSVLTLESELGTPCKLYLDSMNPGDGRSYAVEDSHGRRPLGNGRAGARGTYNAIWSAIEALRYRETNRRSK